MKNQQVTSLHFAVRFRVLLKYGGQLFLVFSILTCVTLVFALLAGDFRLAWIYAAIIIVVGLTGFLLQRIEAPVKIQDNEAVVLSAMLFIITPLLATIPFQQSGLLFIDAFFEAVSAITTTGLSTLPTVENTPVTFLFARAWLQWVGGLGIVVLSVAFLLPHSQPALRLFSGNRQKDDLIASARTYARAVLKVYILLTLAGIGILLLLGEGWLDAITHILAAVSTGGFSTFDNSLAGLTSWYSRAVVTLFCLLGAVSLSFYYQIFQGGLRKPAINSEVVGLLVAAIFASILLSASMLILDGFSLRQALLNSPLLALSAQTTAGFSSVSVQDLSNGSKALVILMMTIGGNVGSTAGGIKIMRLLIIFKAIHLLIMRSGLATGTVTNTRFMGKRLEADEVERCFILVVLLIATIFLSWLVFVFMGYPALDSLFEVVSACGTVGLSSGVTSLKLPAILKGVLCLDMLMGRLEIIALLIFFYPPTWFGRKRTSTFAAGSKQKIRTGESPP